MTQPYGIPYTVRGWGDEVVTTVAIHEYVEQAVPEGFTAIVRSGPGPVTLVPTVSLTLVDTTPAEPEPGAWLIGDVLCVRFPGDDGDHRWQFWNALDGRCDGPWYAVWQELGGHGVTIRRLIPEPAPVELPWTMDGGHATVELGPTLRLAGGCDALFMGRGEAIELGRALIEAGRSS